MIQEKPKPSFLSQNSLWIIGTLLLTVLVYFPSLQNNFVNWDDQLYVYENPLIFDLVGNFSRIIVEPVAGNYHPVTVLTLALDYSIAGLNPFQYHLSNLFWHLLNIVLVFGFVYRLSDRNTIVSGITALFFAIHPVHVESVAWISGRKDLVYTAFFLLSLIAYLNYLSKEKWHWLLGGLGLFVLSAAAKPAAVVLPIVLLLIDYLKARPLNLRLVLEKVPFFAVSLAFGLLTISAQQEGGAVGDFETYTILQRILFGCYGLMMYVYKALVPIILTNLYSYPKISEGLPILYYISPVVVLLVAGLAYKFRNDRKIVFAVLFFLVNLLLVLQIVTVGSAIIADRYTYVPYISIGLLLGYIGLFVVGLGRKPKQIITGLGIVIAAVFSYLSFQQTKVWENGETLWVNAIQQEPISRNHAALGDFYKKNGAFDQALAKYTDAINLRPEKYDHWGDRGTTYFSMGNYQAAIQDFQKSLELKPDAEKVHRNMGSALGAAGRYQEALGYFNRALELEPNFPEAVLDRGNLYIYLQNFDQALKDFQAYLDTNPIIPSFKAYNGIGVVYYYKGEYQQAINYYSQAIAIDANDAQVYYNRSVCYSNLGNKPQALADALEAQRRGMPVDATYLQNLQN